MTIINPVQGVQVQNFGSSQASTQQVIPEKKEHKSSDGKLILGVLAAGAATVGAIALIKNHSSKNAKLLQKSIEEQVTKLKTDVFEPLKDFKGTNEEYAQKAYEHIAKSKGFEGAAPELKFFESNTPMGGGLTFTDGKISLNKLNINEGTHSDILGIITHELDHFERIGDIVRVKGVDEFVNIYNKNSSAQFDQFLNLAKQEIAGMKNFNLNKEQLVEALNKENPAILGNWFPKGIEHLTVEDIRKKAILTSFDANMPGALEKWFPEGAEKVSIDDIIKKYEETFSGNPNEIRTKFKELMPKNADQPFLETPIEINKEFWQNFVAKKGTIKASELKYDITPFMNEFEKNGFNTAQVTQADSAYSYFKNLKPYLSNPFEHSAFEMQFQTVKAHEEFLKNAGIKFNERKFGDTREASKFFEDKIDPLLIKNYPDEAIRKEAFNEIGEKIHREHPILNEKGEQIGSTIKNEKEFFEKMLAELQKPVA